MAQKCPSCGGSKIGTIRFQGEIYYQCQSPVVRPAQNQRGAPRPGICHYWSTKWRPEGGNRGD